MRDSAQLNVFATTEIGASWNILEARGASGGSGVGGIGVGAAELVKPMVLLILLAGAVPAESDRCFGPIGLRKKLNSNNIGSPITALPDQDLKMIFVLSQ